MKTFEVGKRYWWCQQEFGYIQVIRRTDKYIYVKNEHTSWRMKIRKCKAGSEYLVDSSVPARWRDAFTCFAGWEVK